MIGVAKFQTLRKFPQFECSDWKSYFSPSIFHCYSAVILSIIKELKSLGYCQYPLLDY
jgi:hypothetical protein